MRSSEHRFREMADTMPQIIWTARADGYIDYYNRRFYELTGAPEGEFGDGSWAAVIHPDDLPATGSNWYASVRTGKPLLDNEFRVLDVRTGVFRWHLSRAMPLRDALGNVTKWVGTATDIDDIRRTDEALHASEERLRAALASSGTGTFRWDIRTDSVQFDENLNRLFGRGTAAATWTLAECAAMLHPDDRAGLIERCTRCRDEGADFEMEFRVVWPDGSVHWLEDKGKTFRDANGRPTYMTGACVDVTARKAAEDALREGEAFARSIVDSSPDCVKVLDPDGRLLSLSTAALCLMELDDLSPLVGKPWSSIWPDPAPVQAAVAEASAGRTARFSGFCPTAKGSPKWWDVIVKPVLGAGGEVRRLVATSRDVTESRLAEERLRDSEQRLRQLADAMPQIVWMTNAAGEVEYFNRRWTEYTGLAIDQSLGNAWGEVLHPDDAAKAFELWKQAVRSGKDFENEHRFRRHDGIHRWQLARGIPIRDDSGNVVRWFGTCTDIHEQKLAREEARSAREEAERANRAKDEFLAALSHELRTPLTPVLMTAQLWERDASLPEPLRHDLRMIRRNVEIETRLIDDLLDLTRISRGKIHLQATNVDLHDVIRHAVETCRDDTVAQKRLTLSLDLAADGHHVLGDAARLGQVVWNLVKNAVKFTPEGGVVTVSTTNTAGGRVTVSVRDTGVGIDSANLPHIFNAFEQGSAEITRRFGGLGLGLAISRALVEMHGGTIGAESAGRGRGATFTVEVPTVMPAPQDVSPTPARGPKQAAPSARRILLVEDHEQTGRVIKRLLEGTGYDVHWASNVAEALSSAQSRPFDLVVSDLGLPDGDGHQLMVQLRERFGLRGIALSGYGTEQDLHRSAASGFLRHLVKPVSIEALEAALRESVGG